MKCFHLFMNGFGMFGDALVCTKCNYSKYPEAIKHYWFYQLFNRILHNDGSFIHSDSKPYVYKLDDDSDRHKNLITIL